MEEADLQALRLVAEELSFTRAAARLHVTQPSLSQRIQRFERRLGVRLFERNNQEVSLTPAGRALLDRADQITSLWLAALQESRQADRAAVSGDDPPFPKRMRIAIYSLAVGFLLDHLHEADPSVRWEITPFDYEDSLARLSAAELEAIVGFRIPGDPLPQASQVRTTLLVREPVWVAVSTSGPWAQRPMISLADLADMPWVAHPDGPLRLLIETACAEAGFRPDVRYESRDNSAIRLLVSSGRAITLAAPASPPKTGVAVVPLHRAPHRRCYLAWHKDRLTDVQAAALRTVVLNWYHTCIRQSPRYRQWILAHPDDFPDVLPIE